MAAENALEEDIFNELAGHRAVEPGKFNYCPQCNVSMEIDGCEYMCPKCGQIQERAEERAEDSETNSSIKLSSANGRSSRFYINNSASNQKDNIYKQLIHRYNNPPESILLPPKDVLNEVAETYASIQSKVATEYYDKDGISAGTKKFVHRSYIRSEILACLIDITCKKHKTPRSKTDIAKFMGLGTAGYSRGENKLRAVVPDLYKSTEAPDDASFIDVGYIGLYFATLSIDPKYTEFIVDIVKLSEDENICMSSQPTSKIVGAIWVLITQMKLPITLQTVESAANKIKRNTFMKFAKAVTQADELFDSVFEKHGIPAPLGF